METLAGRQVSEMNRVDFFTSHEGLHLHYEEAQTRQVPHRSGYYNLSTHMPWIGMRTAQVDGAHVEYFRGLANPIGLKVGPVTTPQQLVALLDILDPAQEPGRIAVIHRFGVRHIEEQLPRFVEAVHRAGRRPLWICDPMHGNTEATPEGFKTRRFEAILGEVERSIEIHLALGGHLGGVHFELTGENVTECIGGARGLTAADLGRDYRSTVDPRLNYEQSLELALLVARKLGARKG
jgi:3-deoxy-7-phosphoheptulonate synthase